MTPRLFTDTGGEIIAFPTPQIVVVRHGTRLQLHHIDDLVVVDPDAEAAREAEEDYHFGRSVRVIQTNAIAGPQTGRGVR